LPLKQPARKQPSTQKKARTEGDLPPGEDNSDFPLTQPAQTTPLFPLSRSLLALARLKQTKKKEMKKEMKKKRTRTWTRTTEKKKKKKKKDMPLICLL
jgi:hypothetical protein